LLAFPGLVLTAALGVTCSLIRARRLV